MRFVHRFLAAAFLCLSSVVLAADYQPEPVATFSIVARDSATGELGVAVASDPHEDLAPRGVRAFG